MARHFAHACVKSGMARVCHIGAGTSGSVEPCEVIIANMG